MLFLPPLPPSPRAPNGRHNLAHGPCSFAAGRHARALGFCQRDHGAAPNFGYAPAMSRKAAKVTQAILHLHGGGFDPHYLGFFEAFNRQQFYEAHDILETLWLQDRRGQKGDFYKGLIQLAGAFVHVQKGRPGPAMALLQLARANLQKYAPAQDGLVIRDATTVIEQWETTLKAAPQAAARPDWPFLSPG